MLVTVYSLLHTSYSCTFLKMPFQFLNFIESQFLLEFTSKILKNKFY